MKKVFLALLVISFCAGFFVHAILFPDLFSSTPNLEITKQKILGETVGKTPDSTEINPALTIVEFKNGKFKPSKAYIKEGYYIAIRNTDPDNFMWLLSKEKDFTTVRNYGLSEEVKKRMDLKGTYEILEKNSEASLTVVVQ